MTCPDPTPQPGDTSYAEWLERANQHTVPESAGKRSRYNYSIVYLNWYAHGRLDVPEGYEIMQILERYPDTVLALLREER